VLLRHADDAGAAARLTAYTKNLESPSPYAVPMLPETEYARRDELHLAYQVLGDGPPDLLLVDQWFTHVDAGWDVPPIASLRERLAGFGRLILFDKRGTGLSDPIPTSSLPTLDEFIDDIPAVLDAVGAERVVVIANIGGGILAMPFTAKHPDRVSSLVLIDCFARLLAAPDFPVGAPADAISQALDMAERDTGRGVMLDLFAPSLAGDERIRRAWARYERSAATPGSTEAFVRLMFESDVREVLPTIGVQTLVIQRADVPGLVEQGRYLAAHIPNARYIELPGTDSLMWAGDQDAVVAEIQDFVTGKRPLPDPRRVLAAVLFTDIVGSTELAAQLGDAPWESLLADHNRTVRRQLERFGGTAIKVTGDGFLATFDGPARAVRGAMAIRDAVADLGVQIRAGIHVGEIEVLPDDVAGLAVHIAARVSARAGGGEILVSSTVRDLVVGSGLDFEDRGIQPLKGVPGEWRLLAVRG
jgi:class 3 adenylate cyclase